MFETKLQLRRESGEPKCANCSWWGAILVTDAEGGPRAATVAPCTLVTQDSYPLLHQNRNFFTTDLTVCSRWQQKSE